MKRIKMFIPSLILLTIYFVIIGILAYQLPKDAMLPIHFNAKGVADGFAARDNALLFAIGVNLALFLLLFLLPYYSPKYRQQEKRFEKLLPRLSFQLLFFFSLINILIFCYPLYDFVYSFKPILLIIGLMLVFVGNILPKVPRNFFVGIRTPWSISDEDNWHHTHRIGAWCFVIGGLLLSMMGIIATSDIISHIASIVIGAIVIYPALYSFIYFRKQGKKGEN